MKGKIHNILNKELSKNNIKLLLLLGFIFVFLVGIVSYTIANNKSYALFENQATGSETLTIHYEEENPITVLFADGTLIINEKPSKRSANITAHGAVSHEYPGMREQGTDVQKYIFEDETDQPWNADAASITKVEMGQKVYPVSTAYWFYGLTHMSEGDFTNLSTKKVKDMKNMFYQAGYDSSVTSFRLIGLSSWDTSKVENMWAMFLYAGYYATAWDIGDLSAWNTSKVTRTDGMFLWAGYNATTFSIGNLSEWTTTKVVNMQSMFQECGYNSTAWSVGDLSGWDVSSVTNMNNLFYQAAYSATTFSVGNLDNWDTLNVTDMQAMFFQAGRNATTWNVGNLSNWNTSKVVTMHQMFFNAGQNTTTWSIGSLSGWDTSKVTDMQYMFCGAGYNTSTFSLNLANWDVSNVEIMSYMFQDSGYSATTWEIGNLTNWNTTNVTTMESMFYRAGYNATTWNSIGTLKTYADNISYMFNNCTKAKATLNLYSNPDETNYHNIFGAAATASGALITVNYTTSVTNINAIIATKGSTSNVVKGSVIS